MSLRSTKLSSTAKTCGLWSDEEEAKEEDAILKISYESSDLKLTHLGERKKNNKRKKKEKTRTYCKRKKEYKDKNNKGEKERNVSISPQKREARCTNLYEGNVVKEKGFCCGGGL